MHVIKELAEGREVDYAGVKVRIPWVRDGKLDVWMAGYGPKALSLVGRKADGFILQLADPVILEWTMKHVHDAAIEAGRDPKEVKICVAAPAYVGDDLAHQRDQCRWFGGHGRQPRRRPGLALRRGRRGPARPHRLHKGAREATTTATTAGPATPRTDFVPDDIVDRFCVLGTVEDHVAKLTRARGSRRGPVQHLPHARREGGDARRLRGGDHTGVGIQVHRVGTTTSGGDSLDLLRRSVPRSRSPSADT